MPERPLLFFPSPSRASREKRPSGFSKISIPSASFQFQRFQPKLKVLVNAFEKQRIQIRSSITGVEPEFVLVIETIGDISNFHNAVAKIEGFEWLSEFALDNIEPDDIFFDQADKTKPLSGKVYMVFSNLSGMQQLISLWERYSKNYESSFEHGLAPFKSLFTHVKDIRLWNYIDRLENAGFISYWEGHLDFHKGKDCFVEVELWFRQNSDKRNGIEKRFKEMLSSLSASVVDSCVISEISYHALLIKVNYNVIVNMVNSPEYIEFVKCDDVMLFRPTGQMLIINETIEEVADVSSPHELASEEEPVIGLLDGLPLSNHNLLKDRLVLDDPYGFEDNIEAKDRIHGTSMASQILYGDYSLNKVPLKWKLYVRPILFPQTDFHGKSIESIPENILLVDLIHASVKRMLDGDGEFSAQAPSVKVINLSLGIRNTNFNNTMSPLAKLLDWLSYKYNVLFIVSAGNCENSFDLGISYSEFSNLDEKQQVKQVISRIYATEHDRKIISPAESINSITVGAQHDDKCFSYTAGNRVDICNQPLASTISRLGLGYRRSVKPDLIHAGGRQLYTEPIIGSETLLKLNNISKEPGIYSASPGGMCYSRGTSNATALTSHNAGICLQTLEALTERGFDEYGEKLVPILKAMLIHGCSWGDLGNIIREAIKDNISSKRVKPIISKWLGYGVPDIKRVIECTEQRATVIGFGELDTDEADLFDLPLPPSLASVKIPRKLTITLAWISGIEAQNQKYRQASLWFESPRESFVKGRQEADWRSVRNGTIQHEIFEGNDADPYIDGEKIRVKINCRGDAGKLSDKVKYGLLVTLEVKEGVNVPLYTEIKDRIQIGTSVQINM
ncbi:S8 family peptidase [Geovibrio ferrireducens]|uniref:S8 family peptidase n=1 Tax=Geovibrio ferrireducens TaxID=46201 RepID=UPI002246C053|nr:S8 family peptidase [Geovibrio ferrireducens]